MSERAAGRSPRVSWGPFLYTGALAIVWFLLAAVAVRNVGYPRPEDAAALLVMTAMGIISVHVHDDIGRARASFLMVVLLSCLPLFGPLVAGILGLLWAVGERRPQRLIAPIFNGLMSGVTALVGGFAYYLSGGLVPITADLPPNTLLLKVGLPLVVADLVMTCTNAALLTAMIAMTGGKPRTVLMGAVRELLPLYLTYAVIAFVFVVLWVPAGTGPLSAVLIAVPLVIARFVYTLYGDKVRAHARILSLFAQAGDGPGGSVARHAARVDTLCQGMAAGLGLSETDRRLLEYAAALHDVAMKGVLRETDQARTAGAYATNILALLPHPGLAEEVMTGVDFLQGAAGVVRAHHERMDGRGYPDGLVGDEIPITARVLAVADAFDALTTTRGEVDALGKEDAYGELDAAVGNGHLDQRVVQALRSFLQNQTWDSCSDPASEGSWLWDHHALPAMSEVIADEIDAGRTTR
ncbi:MAG: HD domain-containing phosphohydrolase [Dermatophilaceae bacterium]